MMPGKEIFTHPVRNDALYILHMERIHITVPIFATSLLEKHARR